MSAIKSASEALSQELSKIGEIMAKAAQSASAGASTDQKNPDDKGEGNVRDAEFKEGDKK